MTDQTQWVTVAIILRPHGLGGALVLKPLTRNPDDLLDASLDTLHLRLRGKVGKSLEVERFSVHKGQPLVWFKGIEDRTAAEAYIGYELVIPESDRWELEDGQYYFDELEGLQVFTESDDQPLGPVLRIHEGAAHDYLVIAHPNKPGQEVLVPFVQPDCVRSIDLDAGRIVVRLPDGLLDL
jgi:16S rRNA processing protein RimM